MSLFGTAFTLLSFLNKTKASDDQCILEFFDQQRASLFPSFSVRVCELHATLMRLDLFAWFQKRRKKKSNYTFNYWLDTKINFSFFIFTHSANLPP